MKLLGLLAKGLDGLICLTLLLLVLVPPLYLQATINETYKVPQEFLIVSIGWVYIGLVAVQRSFAGQSLWGGGRGSWARRGLILLTGWLGLSALLGYAPARPCMFALTVVSYLLIGQSVLDWTEGRLERRNWVIGALSLLVGIQVIIGLAEFFGAPFSQWASALPTFDSDQGSIPGGWWLHDFAYVLQFPTKDHTPVGTLGNVNYLAELLALTLPVLAAWGMSIRNKVVKAAASIGFLFAIATLVSTGTRAAFLGLLLSGVVASSLVWGIQKLRLKDWWESPAGKRRILAGAMIGVPILMVAGGTLATKLSRGIDNSIQGRWMIWQNALSIWAHHPWLGAGLGSFRLLNVSSLEQRYPDGLPLLLSNIRFGQVHNDPLQALTELGLIGAAVLLFIAVAWWREVLKNDSLPETSRFGLLMGMGAVLVASCFGFPFHIPVTALAIVLVLSLGIARSREVGAPLPKAWRPIYATAALAVVTVLGVQVVQKDVWPLFLAHRYEFVGKFLRDQDRSRESQVVYDLALRYNRFGGGVAYYVLNTLADQKRYDDILSRYDDLAARGMGSEGLYWKAKALQETGHTIEAVNAYNHLIRYFGNQDDNAKRSKRRLAEIASKLIKEKDTGGLKLVIKHEATAAKAP